MENTEYNEVELDSPETLETVETFIKNDIEQKSEIKLNRAQRRALAKKAGKKGRGQLDTISETAKKLNYISLIQELRKLNEEKENKENEAVKDGNSNF